MLEVLEVNNNKEDRAMQGVLDKLWVLLSLHKENNLLTTDLEDSITNNDISQSEIKYEIRESNAARCLCESITNYIIDCITENTQCTSHSLSDFVFLLGRVSDAFLSKHSECTHCEGAHDSCCNEISKDINTLSSDFLINVNEEAKNKRTSSYCPYDHLANQVEQLFVKMCHAILLYQGTISLEMTGAQRQQQQEEQEEQRLPSVIARAIWSLTESIYALEYSFKSHECNNEHTSEIRQDIHTHLTSLCYGVMYIFLRSLAAATNGHQLERWVHFYSKMCTRALEEVQKETQKINLTASISDDDSDTSSCSEDDDECYKNNVLQKNKTECSTWCLVKSKKISMSAQKKITKQSLSLWSEVNNVELLNRTVGRTKYRRAILRFRSFTPYNILQDPVHSIELIELLHRFADSWREAIQSTALVNNSNKNNHDNNYYRNDKEYSLSCTTNLEKSVRDQLKLQEEQEQCASIINDNQGKLNKVQELCLLLRRYAAELRHILVKSAMNASLLISIIGCYLCEEHIVSSDNDFVCPPTNTSVNQTPTKATLEQKAKPVGVVTNLSKRRTLAELRSEPLAKIIPVTPVLSSSLTKLQSNKQNEVVYSFDTSIKEQHKKKNNNATMHLSQSSNKKIEQLIESSKWLALDHTTQENKNKYKFVPIGLLLEILHINFFTMPHWFLFVQRLQIGQSPAKRAENTRKLSLVLWMTSLIDLPLSLSLYHYACQDVIIPPFKYNEHYHADNFSLDNKLSISTSNSDGSNDNTTRTKASAQRYDELYKQITCNENDVMVPGLELAKYTTSMNYYASCASCEFILHPTNTSSSSSSSSLYAVPKRSTQMRKGEQFGERFAKLVFHLPHSPVWPEHGIQKEMEEQVSSNNINSPSSSASKKEINSNVANGDTSKIIDNYILSFHSSVSPIHFFITLLLSENYEHAARTLAYWHDEMHINIFLISHQHLPWGVSASMCLYDTIMRWLQKEQSECMVIKQKVEMSDVCNTNDSKVIGEECYEGITHLLRRLNQMLPLLRYAQSYLASQRLLYFLLDYLINVSELFTILQFTSKLFDLTESLFINVSTTTASLSLIEEYLIEFVFPCLGVLSPSPVIYAQIKRLFCIMSEAVYNEKINPTCKTSAIVAGANAKGAFLNIDRWWSYGAPESSLLMTSTYKKENSSICIESQFAHRIYFPHEITHSKELQSLFVQSLKRLNHDNLEHYSQLLRSVLYAEPLFVIERIFNHAIGYENNFMSLHVRLLTELPSAFYTLAFHTGVSLMYRYATEEKFSFDSDKMKSNNRVSLIAHFLAALLRENVMYFERTEDQLNMFLLFRLAEAKLRHATYSDVEEYNHHSTTLLHRSSMIVGLELVKALCYELLHRQCESEERFNEVQIESMALPHSALATQFAARGSLESLRLVRWNRRSEVGSGEQFSTCKLYHGRLCFHDALLLHNNIKIRRNYNKEGENDSNQSEQIEELKDIVDKEEEKTKSNAFMHVSFSLGQLILLHLCRLHRIIFQAQSELDGPIDVLLLTSTREYNAINDLIFIIAEALQNHRSKYDKNCTQTESSSDNNNNNNNNNNTNKNNSDGAVSICKNEVCKEVTEENNGSSRLIVSNMNSDYEQWCALLETVTLPHVLLAILARLQSSRHHDVAQKEQAHRFQWNDRVTFDKTQLQSSLACYCLNYSSQHECSKDTQISNNNNNALIPHDLLVLLSSMNSSSFKLITEPFTVAKAEVQAALQKAENLRLYMTYDEYLESIAWLREQKEEIETEELLVQKEWDEETEQKEEEQEESNHQNTLKSTILQTMRIMFSAHKNNKWQNNETNSKSSNNNCEYAEIETTKTITLDGSSTNSQHRMVEINTEFVASYLYPRALLSLSDAHFVGSLLSWLYTSAHTNNSVIKQERKEEEEEELTQGQFREQIVNMMCIFVTMVCTFFVGLTDSETRRVGFVIKQIINTFGANKEQDKKSKNGDKEGEISLLGKMEKMQQSWQKQKEQQQELWEENEEESKEKKVLLSSVVSAADTTIAKQLQAQRELLASLFDNSVRPFSRIAQETIDSNIAIKVKSEKNNCTELSKKTLNCEETQYIKEIGNVKSKEYQTKDEQTNRMSSALPLQVDAMLVEFLYNILHNHEDIPTHIHRNALSLTDLLIKADSFPVSITSGELLIRVIASHANERNANYAAAMATMKSLRVIVHRAKHYLSTLQKFVYEWHTEMHELSDIINTSTTTTITTKEVDENEKKDVQTFIIDMVYDELTRIKERELYMQALLHNVLHDNNAPYLNTIDEEMSISSSSSSSSSEEEEEQLNEYKYAENEDERERISDEEKEVSMENIATEEDDSNNNYALQISEDESLQDEQDAPESAEQTELTPISSSSSTVSRSRSTSSHTTSSTSSLHRSDSEEEEQEQQEQVQSQSSHDGDASESADAHTSDSEHQVNNDNDSSASVKSVGEVQENVDNQGDQANNSHTNKRARNDVNDNSDFEEGDRAAYHNDLAE